MTLEGDEMTHDEFRENIENPHRTEPQGIHMMHFRLRLKFRDIKIGNDHLINFEMKTAKGELVSVELRQLTDVELRRLTDKEYNCMCTAVMEKKMTRKIRGWLEKTEEPPPSGFSEFKKKAYLELSDAAVRAVKLFRWRIGYYSASGSNSSGSFIDFKWSINDTDWNLCEYPSWLTLMDVASCNRVTDEIVESILSLSRCNTDEPLAHELFQEALSQRFHNPRSSLVMVIVAAETGLKKLISELDPAKKVAWFDNNEESPPLLYLLENELPNLLVRSGFKGKVLCPHKWVIDSIRKGVERRNKIVHGHDIQLKSDSCSLRDVIKAVSELLYLFDLYSGNEWAVEYASQIESSLKDEAATPNRR